MTLTLEFQGQILKKSWLSNGLPDWHGTKGMWVDRMLDSHCDFEIWPHPWPIFSNSCISGMGGPINMEWKGYESIGCDLLCDLELWLWPWILKVKYLKSSIIEIRGWIDIKGCESIGCWTQFVTSNFYPTHDIDLVFSRSNFNSHILGMGRLIDLEWKRCELDARWASSWPTVPGK